MMSLVTNLELIEYPTTITSTLSKVRRSRIKSLGNPISSRTLPFNYKDTYERRKNFVKWRRLSQTKMFNFSTTISDTSDPAVEEEQRRLWYLTNFQNSYYGITQNPLLLVKAPK